MSSTEYNILQKVTANSETTKAVYSYTNELEAKKVYHQKLGSTYATQGLEKALVMLFNDIGGVIAKESYEIPTYTVIFDANGGVGTMNSQEFKSGIEQELTTNAFTYEGKTFMGWATNAKVTTAEYTDGESITVTDNTILYAIWS